MVTVGVVVTVGVGGGLDLLGLEMSSHSFLKSCLIDVQFMGSSGALL